MLKQTLIDVLDSNRPGVGQSDTIYNLINSKKRELFSSYVETDRAKNATISNEDIKIKAVERQLKQYVKSYMTQIDNIIDVMMEKQDKLTGDTLAVLQTRKSERAEVNSLALERAAAKKARLGTVQPVSDIPKTRGRKAIIPQDPMGIVAPKQGRPKLDILISQTRLDDKARAKAAKEALKEEKKAIKDRDEFLTERLKASKAAEKESKAAERAAKKAARGAAAV
jgi:hypothetical protein